MESGVVFFQLSKNIREHMRYLYTVEQIKFSREQNYGTGEIRGNNC